MRSAAVIVCLLVLSGASATTYTSGGSCTATATTQQEGYARDACLEAIATAVNKGCSATQGRTLVAEFTGIFRAAAIAVARVATRATAHCSTWGNAYGCAAGKATAQKYAQAQFYLFAEAFAKALNNCPDCDPKAAAAITTEMLIEIVAAAFSKSSAAVCVGPNQTAQAVAYERCTAIIIARGFAVACAKALIAGGCMSQSAIAEASAEVSVTTNIKYCACSGYKYTTGQGWSRASRDGYADCYDYQVY